MTETFADSSCWIALVNAKDTLHEAAQQTPCPGRLVTTLAVQLEVMDAFSSLRFRPLASLFWQMTSSNPDVVVVEFSEDLVAQAVNLFNHRADKSWTLTDCVSFSVMKERNITEALTSDHHFEQAGFRISLRPE